MRVSEADVAEAVLHVLAAYPNGEATISEIVKAVPSHLALSDEDLETSKTRPNEALWEQQVRNITSHQKSPGNYVNDGYLEVVKGGLKITAAGRHRIGA